MPANNFKSKSDGAKNGGASRLLPVELQIKEAIEEVIEERSLMSQKLPAIKVDERVTYQCHLGKPKR